MLLLAAVLASGCSGSERDDTAEISFGAGENAFRAEVSVPDGEAASVGTYSGSVTYPDGRTFVITGNRRGSITDKWLHDLGGNEYPELIIWMVEAGSGSYAAVHIFWMTEDGPRFEDATEIPDPLAGGYMGHDTLAVADSRLRRCFPTYDAFDTNFEPTGDTQCLVYNSMRGWVVD